MSTEAAHRASTIANDAVRKKQKVPAGPKSSRDKLGGGRSPHALSRCNHWAPAMRVGCSPTPFSVTRGVVGLIAGPSKASRHLNYWVRFVSPLQPVVAATDLRTRLGRGSELFTSKPSGTKVGHRFWRCVGPCHGSRLLPLRSPFRSHGSATVFCIATASDGFHGRCLGLVAIPTGTPALSLLSEDFVWLAVSGQFLSPAVLMLQ